MKQERAFKWYVLPTCIMPEDKEMIQFEDVKNILHLGRYYKKDQFDREDIFVSTEGAYFQKSEVTAWLPTFKRFDTFNYNPNSELEKELSNLSSHNKSIIADLKAQRDQITALQSQCTEKEEQLKFYQVQHNNIISDYKLKLEELKAENERLKRLVPDHPKEML